MKIHDIHGSLLFKDDADNIRDTIVAAVKANAILYGADLTGACLTRANLTGADFTGANLYRDTQPTAAAQGRR